MSAILPFPPTLGVQTSAGVLTARSIVERYLQHCAANNIHSPEARAQREYVFRTFLEWKPGPDLPPLGDWPISSCEPYHMQDWIESHAAWRSSSTRKAKANIINAAFNWAKKGRRITDNPFQHVNYDEAERRPCMTDDTLGVVMDRANKAFERACAFLRLTGCRLSSMFRLRWEHIDWDRCVAQLPARLSKRGKKTGKGTTIVLLPEAMELLRKVKAETAGEGEVFRNTRGTPWNRRTLGQQLRRMKTRLKIQTPATLHGIRHQVGTEVVRAGVSVKFASRLLGHSSTAVTERFYVHDDEDIEAMRKAAEAARPKSPRK